MKLKRYWEMLLVVPCLCAMARAGPIGDTPETRDGNSTKTESVAYLGVTAKAVDDTLRAQLNLPEDVGLTVMTIDHNGPSAADLQVNDVLQKLDDQLLIDAHQMVTLIHLHHPGDTVTLTVIRKAKPIQVTIKLGQKTRVIAPSHDADPQADLLDTKSPDGFPPPAGFDSSPPTGSGNQTTMSFKDDVYSAYINADASGRKHLTVKDQSGNVVAQGPADTSQEWNKFSPDIQKHLEVMRKMIVQPQR